MTPATSATAGSSTGAPPEGARDPAPRPDAEPADDRLARREQLLHRRRVTRLRRSCPSGALLPLRRAGG